MPQEYYDRDKEHEMDVKEDVGAPYIPEVVEHHDEPEVIGAGINNHVAGGLFDPPPIQELEHHELSHHEVAEGNHGLDHEGLYDLPPIHNLEQYNPHYEHGEYVHEAKTHPEKGKNFFPIYKNLLLMMKIFNKIMANRFSMMKMFHENSSS